MLFKDTLILCTAWSIRPSVVESRSISITIPAKTRLILMGFNWAVYYGVVTKWLGDKYVKEELACRDEYRKTRRVSTRLDKCYDAKFCCVLTGIPTHISQRQCVVLSAYRVFQNSAPYQRQNRNDTSCGA